MARNIADIQKQMIDDMAGKPELSSLNSPSQTAIWRGFTYIVAVAISLFEQLLDIFKTDVEAKLQKAIIGNPDWIMDQIFKFQYSSSNPQDIVLIDFVPVYPVIDESLRIITRASLVAVGNRVIQVKVAKNEPPEALTFGESNSLFRYLKEILPAGVFVQIISIDPDLMRIEGEIFYNGLYSPVIQTDVNNAINNYFKAIKFNGDIILSDLILSIKAVVGVEDVSLTRVSARMSSTPFDLATNISVYRLDGTSQDINSRFYSTFSGYVVTETGIGHTIRDTLTFTIS